MVRTIPPKIFLVADRESERRKPSGVVLDYHDTGSKGMNGLPNPVIIAIHIDAKQIKLGPRSCVCEQRVNIFPRNELVFDSELASLHMAQQLRANSRHIRSVCLDPESP